MQFRDLKTQYKTLKSDIDEAIFAQAAQAQFISGPAVRELEDELAAYVGVKHCITCGNGTDAITLGLMAWGVGSKDAVFVPDFTFFSSGECPAALGAAVVFADVEADTFNIDPARLEEAIQKTLDEGKYTPRAVVAVDLFGHPADYSKIRPICDKYNLLLLEDGAQGFGGSIDGAKGSPGRKMACCFGDISTTSFFPAKPLGCYGDGGAVFTDNDEWATLIRSLAVHGKNASDKYDNVRLGMNSRLDTIQAAILKVKLKAFKEYELSQVNQVAAWYDEALADIAAPECNPEKDFENLIILPSVRENMVSSFAQYTVILPKKSDRAAIQQKLKDRYIPSMVYYMRPMHLQGAFVGTDAAQAECPVTEELCGRVLSLPMGPYMTREDAEKVSEGLKAALEG